MEELKKVYPDVVEKAVKHGIDVEKIVKEVFERYKNKYSEKTILAKIRSELRKEIEKKSALQLRGIIAGSRDRWGRSFPIRFCLLRSTGEHVELSSWSYENIKIGNQFGEMPVPSIIEALVKVDDEYQTMQLVSINSVRRLSKDEFIEKLLQVAKKPSDIDESSLYKIVVVKGVISSIQPLLKFDNNGSVSGVYPVLSEDARKPASLYPTMQIRLEPDGNSRCRLILERPRYAKPLYLIDDFTNLCMEAMTIKDPAEQCLFLQDYLEGRSIIAVGIVSHFKKARLTDATPVNFIDIGVASIVEYSGEPMQVEIAPKQGEIVQEKEHKQGEIVQEKEQKVEEDIDIKVRDDFSMDSALMDDIDLSEFDEEKSISKMREERFIDFIDNTTWTLLESLDIFTNAKISATSISMRSFDRSDSKSIVALFYDDSIAGFKFTEDGNVYVSCTCEAYRSTKNPCKHLMSLWAYPARDSYNALKSKIGAKEDKRELANIENIKKLISAYCAVTGLSYDSIDEDMIAEKLGLMESRVLIKKAIEELRASRK